VYDEMDYLESADFSRRVMEMHIEDLKVLAKLFEEHAKGTMRAMGARIT